MTVHLMSLKNCSFFRGGGFVIMFKKSPYILEIHIKIFMDEMK